jgi:hypothetical protein
MIMLKHLKESKICSVLLLLGLTLLPSILSAESFLYKPLTPSQNSQFIVALYQKLLGRTPSTGEVTPFLNVLKQGGTRTTVAGSIITSTEFRTKLIQDLYSDYLGRTADAASISAFLNLYAQGGSTQDARKIILVSQEYFTNIAQNTNLGFIDALYTDLLSRTPSLTELQAYLRLIDDSGRSGVVQSILTSNEFRSGLIGLLFQQYLGRTPETFETNTFLTLLQGSTTEDDLRKIILGSDEFFRHVAPPFLNRTSLRLFLGSAAPKANRTDLKHLKAHINWGDGHTALAEIEDAGDGSVRVFATHSFKQNLKFQITATLTLGQEVVRHGFNFNVKSLVSQIAPFPAQSKLAVRVAAGDVNGDGIDDIIVAAGPGGGPHVKTYDGITGKLLNSFLAYDPTFKGGVFVAAGDIDNDGKADIVTGAGPGAGPQVKVFSGADGSVLESFFAFDQSFTGGVSVAVGDVNGDGVADIITSAGPGGGPHINVFSGVDLSVLESFFAFDPGFNGGVFVAAGDVNGDGNSDIITAAGPGGGPHVKVFSGADLAVLQSFDAFSAGFTGGVRVACADVNGDGLADVITAAGPGGGPHVKVFSGKDGSTLNSFFAFSSSFTGGVFVAAGDIDGKGKVSVLDGTGGGAAPLLSVKRF